MFFFIEVEPWATWVSLLLSLHLYVCWHSGWGALSPSSRYCYRYIIYGCFPCDLCWHTWMVLGLFDVSCWRPNLYLFEADEFQMVTKKLWLSLWEEPSLCGWTMCMSSFFLVVIIPIWIAYFLIWMCLNMTYFKHVHVSWGLKR